MKKEREEYNSLELQQESEYQSFQNEFSFFHEQYFEPMEDFKSIEIKPLSTMEDETSPNEGKKTQIKDNLIEKVKGQITNVSSAVSLSSASAVIVLGAAAATVILPPIFTEEPDTPPPLIVEIPTIEVLNHKVEYYQDNNLFKDVYIYFNEELPVDYYCNVLNTNTLEEKTLDLTLDYVMFENLNLEEYEFDVIIYNSESELVHSFKYLLDTTPNVEYPTNIESEYLVTYNQDSYNLYYYPIFENIDLEYYTEYQLYDKNQNLLDYKSNYKNGVITFENIKDYDISINAKTYLIENGNHYLISNTTEFISNPYKPYELTLDNNLLKINFLTDISSDVLLTIDYLDINQSEEIIISNDDITQTYQLNLTKYSNNIKIKLDYETITYNQTNYINEFVGELKYRVSTENDLTQQIDSTLNLIEKIIYKEDSNENIRIKFDGFVNESDKLRINIYDSAGLLINTIDQINNPFDYIRISGLNYLETYRVNYELYDQTSNEVVFTGDYNFTYNIPEEYSLFRCNIACPNPSDIMITYIDDNTFNAYAYMDYNGDLNTYYSVEFYELDSEDYKSHIVISNEKVAELTSLASGIQYGIIYKKLYYDQGTYYEILNSTIPSGSVGIDYDEDGNIYGLYPSVYNNEGMLEISLYDYVESTFDVIITLENGEEVKFDITPPSPSYMYDFTLDLSEYDLTNATITISGMFNSNYGIYGDRILEAIEVSGSLTIYQTYTDYIY